MVDGAACVHGDGDWALQQPASSSEAQSPAAPIRTAATRITTLMPMTDAVPMAGATPPMAMAPCTILRRYTEATAIPIANIITDGDRSGWRRDDAAGFLF